MALMILASYPSAAFETLSETLVDRANKAVLDCLDYASRINCEKAQGAVGNVRLEADNRYQKLGGGISNHRLFMCSLNAMTLGGEVRALPSLPDRKLAVLEGLSEFMETCAQAKKK